MTIHELISINNELMTILDQVTNHNRGESIQSITELLAKREVVLKQLDLSSAKKDPLANQLLSDESEIKKKMEQVLNDIKKDLQLVSKKRLKGGNYINPYKNLYINGAFIDRKK